MRTIISLGWCLLASACGILGPDIETTNRRLLDPVPPEYSLWYAEVESCLGRQGNFSVVSWYVADEIIFEGQSAFGLWEAPNSITLKATHIYSGRTVQHEAIHHIFQKGVKLHATDVFECSGG